LPYWDQTLDSDTGVFYKDPEHYIFGPKRLGGYTGNASEGYVVTDGRFARGPILNFTETLIPERWREGVTSVYKGNPFGKIRAPNNNLDTLYVTRLPKDLNAYDSKSEFHYDGKNDITFTASDAALCSSGFWARNWMEWEDCIENARVRGRNNTFTMPWNFNSGVNWLHSQFHFKIGGHGKVPPTWPNSGSMPQGDFFDVVSSVNDPIFPFHHTNIDRISMAWQHSVESLYPELRNKSWGYPINYTTFKDTWSEWDPELGPQLVWEHGAHEGCGLHDVAIGLMPFTRLGNLSRPEGFTHAEILEATDYGRAPYTYSTFAPSTWGSVIPKTEARPALRGAR